MKKIEKSKILSMRKSVKENKGQRGLNLLEFNTIERTVKMTLDEFNKLAKLSELNTPKPPVELNGKVMCSNCKDCEVAEQNKDSNIITLWYLHCPICGQAINNSLTD